MLNGWMLGHFPVQQSRVHSQLLRLIQPKPVWVFWKSKIPAKEFKSHMLCSCSYVEQTWVLTLVWILWRQLESGKGKNKSCLCGELVASGIHHGGEMGSRQRPYFNPVMSQFSSYHHWKRSFLSLLLLHSQLFCLCPCFFVVFVFSVCLVCVYFGFYRAIPKPS